MILDFLTGPAIFNYVNGKDLARYAQVGVVTPDHTIRTRNTPLIVPAPDVGNLAAFSEGAAAALKQFTALS